MIRKLMFIIVMACCASPAFADRWFGCGRVINLNSYGVNEIRFDIEGADYTGICWYPTVSEYGHHTLTKNADNQWVFAMYLAAALSGRQVKLFTADPANGPCNVSNVPIKYCD
jgi:hypothetical protein